jgi:hypothetical protein
MMFVLFFSSVTVWFLYSVNIAWNVQPVPRDSYMQYTNIVYAAYIVRLISKHFCSRSADVLYRVCHDEISYLQEHVAEVITS